MPAIVAIPASEAADAAKLHTFDVPDAARTDAELGKAIAIMARIGQLHKGHNGGVYARTGADWSSVTVGLYARTVDEFPIMTVAGRGVSTVEIDWLTAVLNDDEHDLEALIRKAIAFLS